jgi:hypothetical protein
MDVVVVLLAVILQFIMGISPVLQMESNYYFMDIFGALIGFLIISGLIILF